MHRRLLLVTIILAGLALDLASKAWAFRLVPSEWAPHLVVVDGFFYIAHARNDGAMWSLFQGLPSWVWIVVRGGVFTGLLFWAWTRPKLPRPADPALGLILAGALGNLHDNVFGDGRVRDFLLFRFGSWSFPMFNAADSMICVGAGLLLIAMWRAEPPRRSQQA
jgi:signal peptidase II